MVCTPTAFAQSVRAPGDRPACPTISVSCPPHFDEGEPITFTARISGGDPNVVPTFEWSVLPGRIIDGQGTTAIRVATAGYGKVFTGTVKIMGYAWECPATASCSLLNEDIAPPSTKVDSYGTLPAKQEISRLDRFAVQLRNQPGAQGYLLVYGGRRSRAGDAEKIAGRSKAYLIKMWGFDANRIVAMEAGLKEKLTIDLWVVPTGAVPPVVQPTPRRSSKR